MAIYGRKDKKIAADVAEKQQYDKYFKKMRAGRRQPMTFAHWKKSGREPVVFKGISKTRDEARFKRSDRKRLGMKD